MMSSVSKVNDKRVDQDGQRQGYGTLAPGWSIRPEEITIAQIAGKAGYTCAHFGKWHLGPVKAASPTNPGAMGFDEWLSHDNFFEMNPWLSPGGGKPQRFKGEGSEVVIDETIRFIGKATKNKKPSRKCRKKLLPGPANLTSR